MRFITIILISFICFASNATTLKENNMEKVRLNLVLIPQDDQINNKMIELSKSKFIVVDKYRLEANKSYPHLSIAQIEIEKNKVQPIINKLLEQKNQNNDTFDIALQNKLFIKTDGWSELRPTLKTLPKISDLHNKIKFELEKIGLSLSNASGINYVPHFTLAKDASSIEPKTLDLDLGILHKNFPCKIAVGYADNIWQFVEIIND